MIKFTRKELGLIKTSLRRTASSWMSQSESEKLQVYRDVVTKIDEYLESIEGAKDATKEIKDTATKLPKKKMKLEGNMENKDLEDMTSKEIYYAGKNEKDFDFNKGLDDLIKNKHKNDEDGFYIYLAGRYWDEFDFNKGTETLINTKWQDDMVKHWPKTVPEIKKKLDKIAAKKKMKLEGNMEFEKYLEEKETEQIERELNEDVASFIASALGYGATGLAGAFGGTLLILGGIRAAKGLVGLWKKIAKGTRELFNPSKVIREVKTDARVSKVKQEMIVTKDKYADELKYVYLAITNKDMKQAKEEFDKISPNLQNSPDVHKAIITEITKSLRMPPIYIQSPGNKSYQAIKRVINIRVARAAAAATQMAFESATRA